MKTSHKWGIGAGLAIIAGIAASIPWTYWDVSVRHQLANQIRLATGLETTSAEKVTIALLPRPHIKLRGVRIRDRWKNLDIDSQIIKGDLRLLPLIAGRLEVSSLSLFLPTITLNVHGRPLHERGAIAMASSKNQSPAQQRQIGEARLGTIHIHGGRLLLKSSSESPVTQIGDVNASLDWPSIASAAVLKGAMIWRGERVELSTTVSKPAELLRAQASPLTLEMKTRLASLSMSGTVSALPGGWLFQGDTAAASPAFRALLSQLGVNWPLPGVISSVQMKGKMTIRPGSASFTNLNLTIDGNAMQGSLSIRQQGKRPLIAGTLASNVFGIDQRSADLPSLTNRDGNWNTTQLPLRALKHADLDLRLSAQEATFNQFKASDVAIVTLLRDGNLELAISSQKAYGGAFSARFGVEQGPAIPAITASLRFNNIDSDSFLRANSRSLRMSGKAEGQITMRSAGASFAEIAGLARGDAKLKIVDGSLAGIDLVEALRLSQSAPLSIPDRIRYGATSFKSFNVEATAKDGRLRLISATINSDPIQSTMTGHIDLAKRQVKMTVAATQNALQGNKVAQPVNLELDVIGPWARPAILPNPESLIMRSKAAEPLLRTIERLREAAGEQGQTPAAAATAPR